MAVLRLADARGDPRNGHGVTRWRRSTTSAQLDWFRSASDRSVLRVISAPHICHLSGTQEAQARSTVLCPRRYRNEKYTPFSKLLSHKVRQLALRSAFERSLSVFVSTLAVDLDSVSVLRIASGRPDNRSSPVFRVADGEQLGMCLAPGVLGGAWFVLVQQSSPLNSALRSSATWIWFWPSRQAPKPSPAWSWACGPAASCSSSRHPVKQLTGNPLVLISGKSIAGWPSGKGRYTRKRR